MKTIAFAVAALMVLAQTSACTTFAPLDFGTVPLDDEHKERALSLISVFENGTPTLAYDYVEDLDDGRGYTCGLGFTTGTGDALLVVERYTAAVADNALAAFLPTLRDLDDSGSDDVSGLVGFADAWQACADDEVFRAIQRDVQDEQSYAPALAHLEALGLRSALALVAVFDTVWMHGDGDDDDSAGALLAAAAADVGTDDEVTFLSHFLDVRRDDVENAHDPATRDEWAEATGRVDVLIDLVDDENFAFDGPLHVGHGYDVDLP